MSLQTYVLKRVSVRVLAAGLALLAVLQILDLLEVSAQIVHRDLGFLGILHYAALRLPRLFDQAAPLGILAGSALAFMKLASDSEIVAMRAAGVSVYRLLTMILPVVLCVMVLDIVAIEGIAPRTDAALEKWWQATSPAATPIAAKSKAFRVGGDLAVATTSDLTGRTLSDVNIYRRDVSGRLVERIKAPSAVYSSGGWRLNDPQFVRFDASGARAGRAAEMGWAHAFKPQDVQALFFGDQTLSAASASRALNGGGAQRPPSYYATRVQRAFAAPLGQVVMLLLTLPIALANFRGSRGAMAVGVGLGGGLLFLVADGLMAALGEGGTVSPILAAWTAPLVFAALGATALLILEG